MFSLKKRQEGFTIIELLIVIVVIGILATLVIVTFTGIQQKARDSKRKTDINAIDTTLESYYGDNNYYPTLAQLNSSGSTTDDWVKDNLKGFDPATLQDPKGTTTTLVAGTTPSATQYAYSVKNATGGTCDNTAGNECTDFTVSAKLEADGSTFSKHSNNN